MLLQCVGDRERHLGPSVAERDEAAVADHAPLRARHHHQREPFLRLDRRRRTLDPDRGAEEPKPARLIRQSLQERVHPRLIVSANRPDMDGRPVPQDDVDTSPVGGLVSHAGKLPRGGPLAARPALRRACRHGLGTASVVGPDRARRDSALDDRHRDCADRAEPRSAASSTQHGCGNPASRSARRRPYEADRPGRSSGRSQSSQASPEPKPRSSHAARNARAARHWANVRNHRLARVTGASKRRESHP